MPVRIQDCTPPGLLGLISSINLVGLDETAAHQTLLDGVWQGRTKPPTAPRFPSSLSAAQRTVTQQPPYQRALAIYEQKLGTDHPRTTRVRNNYTNLVQEMKQKTEAARSKPKAPRKQAKK